MVVHDRSYSRWQGDRDARVPGAWAGRVHGSDDVVASDDDVVALFDESAGGNES